MKFDLNAMWKDLVENCKFPKLMKRIFKQEDFQMPLVKGKAAKSKKGFSANAKREMDSGKSQAQSVAIAYSEAGEKKKKGKKK